MVDFQKKGLDKKKVFVLRDEAPYFSEALGFSLPSLLVNPALVVNPAAIGNHVVVTRSLHVPPNLELFLILKQL